MAQSPAPPFDPEHTEFIEPVVRPIVKATDLGSVQVLKQGNLYLLTDPFGDVHPDSRGLGLYEGDTRRLSCEILRVNGLRPVLLQASAGGNWRGTIQMTNPRIERNLHDGVQQQLVAIGIDLGLATNHLTDDPELARSLIAQARDRVQGSIGELRQLGRGLHPAILEDRGLDAALSAVVAGAPLPISVHVDPRLAVSTDVEETLYFVANEAVANVLKHSHARVASIHVTVVGDVVRITVHDDGRGGADLAGGSGLAGIRARVRGVDGEFSLVSPEGGPTTISAEVPISA